MTIFYSVIARGATVLCSHQNAAGNFSETVGSMLPNIPTRTNAKTSYSSSDNTSMFHVMVENGIIYICATDPGCTKLQAYGFLAEIKNLFVSGSLANRAHFAGENELEREFSPVLEMQMERYSQADYVVAGGGQISILQSQVAEVKDIMTQNIERVIQRGEQLDDLVDKTTELEASADTFRHSTTRVHRKMWWKNMKMKLILGLVILVVLLIIILIILYKTGVIPVKPKPPTPTTTITPTTTTTFLQ